MQTSFSFSFMAKTNSTSVVERGRDVGVRLRAVSDGPSLANERTRQVGALILVAVCKLRVVNLEGQPVVDVAQDKDLAVVLLLL